MRKSGNLKFRPKAILADRGYSSQSLDNYLKMKKVKAITPFKSNEKASQDRGRTLNVQLYKKRNVVERCFAMLKKNIAV